MAKAKSEKIEYISYTSIIMRELFDITSQSIKLLMYLLLFLEADTKTKINDLRTYFLEEPFKVKEWHRNR